MDLSPVIFRPADGDVDLSRARAGDWTTLLATIVARQASSPTAQAQARLFARATRPDGAFARRVAAALAAGRGMNDPFTPPFQPIFNGDH